MLFGRLTAQTSILRSRGIDYMHTMVDFSRDIYGGYFKILSQTQMLVWEKQQQRQLIDSKLLPVYGYYDYSLQRLRVDQIPRWSGLYHFSAIMQKGDFYTDGRKYEDMSKVCL